MIFLRITVKYAIIIHNAVRCWNIPWRHDRISQMLCRMAEHATLLQFYELFNARFRPLGIYAVAFGKHMNREELEDSVYAFQNDSTCKVIICDETGGEGRNFQNAEQIIHLDMPWSANTLEQRIGRLDRLGRSPEQDVLSVVLYAEDSIEEKLPLGFLTINMLRMYMH